MNHGCEQFAFPGLGGATSTTVPAATAAFAARTLLLLTANQNTWIAVGTSPTAAKNTGMLLNVNTVLRLMVANGEKISYLSDSVAGNISIVQIQG